MAGSCKEDGKSASNRFWKKVLELEGAFEKN
jgi:hypothetical protein